MELPLRDIHLPDPISLWPLAVGWWIMFGIILFFLISSFLAIRKLRQPTLKKQAASALAAIEKSYEETDDALVCLTEISAFLRRVMLSQKLFKETAGLTGLDWLQTLDKPLKTDEFSRGVGQILLSGPYSRISDKSEISKLLELCSRWVKAL